MQNILMSSGYVMTVWAWTSSPINSGALPSPYAPLREGKTLSDDLEKTTQLDGVKDPGP